MSGTTSWAFSRRSLVTRSLAAAPGLVLAPALISMTTRAEAAGLDDLPYGGSRYGVCMHGGGVANTRYPRRHAFRFRCERTGFLRSVRWQNRRNYGNDVGYHFGDGGMIRVDLRTNDPASGFPTNETLGSTPVVGDLLHKPRFPIVPFVQPVYVEKGRLYHIVFEQLSNDPNRCVSVNDLHTNVPAIPGERYRYWGDDLASIMFRPTWKIREDRAPIFEVAYTDGIVKGQGITNGGRTEQAPIGGVRKARQSFLLPRTLRSPGLAFWVYRTGDVTGPLTIRLLDETGAERDGIAVEAEAISISRGDVVGATPIAWNYRRWNRTHELAAGSTVRIELSAPEGSSYLINPVQDGSVSLDPDGGYQPFMSEDKLARERQAEMSRDGGRTWIAAYMFDKPNRKDPDFPIYLSLVAGLF